MKLKALPLILLALFVLGSCKKKNTPQKEDYFFTYHVRVSKNIVEPTIISGFHGKVMNYEGDFQPSPDVDPRVPEPVRNEILVFTANLKDKIEAVAYQEEGITFYNLKKLKKQEVLPKYIVKPNKSGFYQMDLGTGEYCFLIRVSKTRGYINGGVQTIKTDATQLKEMEMRIDYKATF
jgi:hypothetical protein